MIRIAFSFGLAFLVGSFPTAYVFAKALAGTDIRRHGSGNVGATNALRVLGKGPGAAVFAIDLLKGLLPVLVYRWLRPEAGDGAIWAGFFAVLGHVFTPWLGFKGGKGVATGAGAVLGGVPGVFWASLPVWLAVFWITRTVSPASLAVLAAAVLFALLFGYATDVVLCLTLLAAFITWTHRENIARLRQGKENRIVNNDKK